MRGNRVDFELLGASENLFSDTTFARAVLGAKSIVRLSERTRVIARARVGWLEARRVDDVPVSTRFFAGGDASVRGFGLNELSPMNDEGELIGGSRLMVGSIEVDWLFKPNWSAALFVDAGVADRGSVGPVDWSVGIGSRWYSPLGPIRVDVALPQTGDDTFRLHISLGPDL